MAVPASEAAAIARSCLARAELEGVEAANEDLQRLVALAAGDDPLLAQSASEALFEQIVETLADRFERRACDLYVQIFGRLIHYCRRLPQGSGLDKRLTAFGLRAEQGFLDRAARVRQDRRPFSGSTVGVKKVIVLSRVTLGADVAVTSVVLDRVKRCFADAEICLVGGAKTGALFVSDRRVRLLAFEYGRTAPLFQRLSSWERLVDCIASETRGLSSQEYLIIDPDSRLTQLGLLPVATEESRYLFFESRSYGSSQAGSLAQLTGGWLDRVFGAGDGAGGPYVELSDEDVGRGEELRRSARSRIAAFNLGVGDNPSKRIGGAFEFDLLHLLLSSGFAVVLDRGAGKEELARTARLLAELQDAGHEVAEADATAAAAPVVVWQGSLSGFAGLIRAADLYVGYDSAGGHLAAALGVPGITVFAGAPSPLFRERWSPWGRSPAEVIAVLAGTAPADILRQIRDRLP